MDKMNMLNKLIHNSNNPKTFSKKILFSVCVLMFLLLRPLHYNPSYI